MKKIITLRGTPNIFFENNFKKENSTYKIISTNYSVIYDTKEIKYVFSSSYLGQGGMNLIMQTKADVKNQINKRSFGIKDVKPKYYKFNYNYFHQKEFKIFNIAEIDINSAYLESARYQNIISDKLYNKLKSISKPMRLSCLGSLATKKFITYYEDNKKIGSEVKQDLELTKVWNMISLGCDELIAMMIYKVKQDFIFYWFDNLFIHSKLSNFDERLYKQNYPLDLHYTKTKNLLNIQILPKRKVFNIPMTGNY